ncbi:alpha/beta hydrolase family protein [Amycolatopsis jiangsuensis]|uniref:Dienelactone hydrolase n=1 Tax=Amycolatopsis jiangsuensis TaxID=1181879 RepID=A0A840J0F2_9PSEU|nr:lipase [Amycolatopsis jiangsuensis]MBB4688436.1 dienelactone hydrolase [Amycolatopsis jiangsuensis]
MRKRLLLLLSAAILAVTSGTATAEVAPVTVTLPQPSGPHAIGERDVHLVDPVRHRELMVSVWYPAEPGTGPRAPYLPAPAADYFDQGAAPILGIEPGRVDWAAIETHARAGAAPKGRWPVLVYSPGWGSLRQLATASAEDLASRGYVVVTVDHTGEAPFVVFPDGRMVTADHGPDLEADLRVRVADEQFVLDRLPGIPGLGRAMDLSHVGAFGHSYGGDTAAEMATVDSRVDAAADLDGFLAYDVDGQRLTRAAAEGVPRPVLLMGSAGSTRNGEVRSHRTSPAWKSLWEHTTAPKYDVPLPTGMHYSFTDLQWLLPQLARKLPVDPAVRQTRIGTIDPAVSGAVQRGMLTTFFGRTLH